MHPFIDIFIDVFIDLLYYTAINSTDVICRLLVWLRVCLRMNNKTTLLWAQRPKCTAYNISGKFYDALHDLVVYCSN